ncbi:MAG TPA: sulfur transferase domain-containing protein [Terriglobia bacterium]|nr:sulfur transferase domain-containing protein [Terriglobia bacterium]
MKFTLAVLFAVTLVVSAAQAQVTKETVPGITNLARVETTVACAGNVTPSAVGEIKKMGFASIINLRQPTEQGADIEGETAAAKTAGIKFYNIPFNNAAMDPAAVDKFLATITQQGNQPAFIHCASGNRAAGMWFVKRVLVDKWDVDKAGTEAAGLGLTNAGLKTFMLDYIKSHSK